MPDRKSLAASPIAAAAFLAPFVAFSSMTLASACAYGAIAVATYIAGAVCIAQIRKRLASDQEDGYA